MVAHRRIVERDESERIDRLFHAMADPTRRDIVHVVLDAELSVTDLAERYPMSFAAVQKHVAVLERAELVHKRRDGRRQLVRADIETLRVVNRLLDQYEAVWRGRIQRMDQILTDRSKPTRRATDDR
jgi:DNA-binding transcriptional ArsR family regulator